MPSIVDPLLTVPDTPRYALVPEQSYAVPGGPYPQDQTAVELSKLSEISRGGPNDRPR